MKPTFLLLGTPVTPQLSTSHHTYVDRTLRQLHKHFGLGEGSLGTTQKQENERARCVLVWVGALRTSLHHLCARMVNDSEFHEAAAASLATASSEAAWRSLSTYEQQHQQVLRALGVCCPA